MTRIDADEERKEHLVWQRRVRREGPADPDELLCASCGCRGNCECGHAPLAAPDHLCELDINDEHESGRCYCCRAVDGVRPGDGWSDLVEPPRPRDEVPIPAGLWWITIAAAIAAAVLAALAWL